MPKLRPATAYFRGRKDCLQGNVYKNPYCPVIQSREHISYYEGYDVGTHLQAAVEDSGHPIWHAVARKIAQDPALRTNILANTMQEGGYRE